MLDVLVFRFHYQAPNGPVVKKTHPQIRLIDYNFQYDDIGFVAKAKLEKTESLSF